MKALFKFANTVTKDPMFSSVVVFTLSFLVAGVLFEMTSAGDGGLVCHENTVQLKNLCTKLNIIFLVLSVSVPIIAGLSIYYVVQKKMESKIESK